MDIRLCDHGKFEPAFEIVKRQKIGMELQLFSDPLLKNVKKHIAYQKEQTKNIKRLSLHAPFWDLNLGSAMPSIRKETMKWFNYAYKIAKELNCDSIVVHDGYVPFTSHIPNWVKRATTFWQEFFADKDDSITMMIENMLELDSSVMIQEIDAVHDKRLKACLDVGHAHGNSDMSVYDWVKTLNNRIGYMHLHNNHGKINRTNNDEHNGFDDGTIDFKKLMKSVKKYCPKAILAVESATVAAEDAIEFLKKNTK